MIACPQTITLKWNSQFFFVYKVYLKYILKIHNTPYDILFFKGFRITALESKKFTVAKLQLNLICKAIILTD